MKTLLISAIRFYRRHISPNKPCCCRFIPTCSDYALTAVSRYGSVKGTAMAIRRIARCNPLCKGGYDPVPELVQTVIRRDENKA